MTYRLFLDDERDPPNDGGEWIVRRSVKDAKDAVAKIGFPKFVSFDNDLGRDAEEGRAFASWLVERDLDADEMPNDFDWYAHTQNPVAKEAIDSLLTRYLKTKGR